jgi:hypothetical protein
MDARCFERKDPEAYKSVNNIIKVRQAALGSLPARSDSNEYVTALSKLKDDEEQMRHELTVALTRTFLDEQGEEA